MLKVLLLRVVHQGTFVSKTQDRQGRSEESSKPTGCFFLV